MNITDWILMAVLTGITIHFTFGKENNYFSRKEERTSG